MSAYFLTLRTMIIRSLRLRHGRLALPRQLPIRRHQSSLQSTETPEQLRLSIPTFSVPSSQQEADVQSTIREVPLNDPNHPVAQDYAFYQHQRKVTQHLGTTIAPHYKPHELLTKPPHPKDITLELLIASQAHIGHSTSLWNPANARYIFGVRGQRDPIHIISPDVTAAHLRRACKVVAGVAERGGLILFVGTRQGQARAVVRAAELAKGCHLFSKWIPGSITNRQQILGNCEKKVVNEIDEDVPGFEDQLPAKAAIKPDLVVCLNPLENYILLHECGIHNIPTIGIIDTDANPTWVTYPIPANDDSLRAVQVIAGVLGRAGSDGQRKRLKLAAEKGLVVYPAVHGLSPPVGRQDDRKMREAGRRITPPPRSPRQLQTSAPRVSSPSTQSTSLSQEEAVFPDEYENVDATISEADQKLLDDSERIMAAQHEEFPSGDVPALAREGVEGAAATPTAESMSDMDRAEFNDITSDVDEEVDPSLTDDNYAEQVAQAEEHADDQDLAQFGVHSDSTEVLEPSILRTTNKDFSDSTMDQVGDVQKELGEEAPEPEVPGGSGSPDLKDVGSGSQAEADAAMDAVKPEEPVRDKKI